MRKKLKEKENLKKISKDLLDLLIAKDKSTGLGCDNMSCIIVDLSQLKSKWMCLKIIINLNLY